MARISINEMTTYRWSFEEDVAAYAALGVDGIGVWRQKISDFGDEKGIELLREKGLLVSSLLWAGGFTGSDGRSYAEGVRDACEAIQLAAAMKAGCLIVYSGSRAGHTFNHAKRLLKNGLLEVMPVAEEFGITLAVEPMHSGCADDWTFLTTIDDALELLDGLNHPQLKLVFDTYHLGHDASIVDRIADLAPHIALVQLGDAKRPPVDEPDRCPLGKGELPLREVTSALKSAGYDGFYELELMGQEIEACDYRDLLSQSKQVFDDLLE